DPCPGIGVRERALRLAHLAQELGLVVEARRDEGARLRVERIASHQPKGPLSLGGDAPVGSEVGEGGEVRVRGAGLAFLQVAQAQVESDGGVARRAGPGALERGRRLVEGAELVAGKPSAREPLADPAPHEERHEERVLAPVRRQNLLLEIGPVVHPLRLPLEGRAVGCAERDADAPCGLDPARLEARPERREVEDAVLHHEPRRDGARPARRRVGRQVHPLRARAYQRVSFTPSQRPTWLTTMWPQKLSRRIVATSVHVSATRVWTRTSAPTTKSSWSNGIHGRPGSTPSRRLKKLFALSPAIAPTPKSRP